MMPKPASREVDGNDSQRPVANLQHFGGGVEEAQKGRGEQLEHNEAAGHDADGSGPR